MRRRFFLAVDGLTLSEQAALSLYINKLGCAWWHWVANVWLLTTANEDFDMASFAEYIDNLCKNGRFLVMETPEDITWIAGHAANKRRRLTDWLRDTWGRQD